MKYALSLLALIVILNFYGCPKSQPVDPPVDTYEEIKIGNQTWMLKNLDVDHYRNGDSIPEVRDSATWVNLTTGAWCYYENDSENGKIYGKLYNWYAVNDPRGLAPKGWHVSTYSEWITLISYLGGWLVSGGKMKEYGTSHWNSPNEGATNESGFLALPGGLRMYDGTFAGIGANGFFWTATEASANSAWGWRLNFGLTVVDGGDGAKGNAFSVRCVKD